MIEVYLSIQEGEGGIVCLIGGGGKKRGPFSPSANDRPSENEEDDEWQVKLFLPSPFVPRFMMHTYAPCPVPTSLDNNNNNTVATSMNQFQRTGSSNSIATGFGSTTSRRYPPFLPLSTLS